MCTNLDSLYISPEGPRFIQSDHLLFGFKSLAELDICIGNWFRKPSNTMVASFELMGSDGEVKKCGVSQYMRKTKKMVDVAFLLAPQGLTEITLNHQKGLVMDYLAPPKLVSLYRLHVFAPPVSFFHTFTYSSKPFASKHWILQIFH